MTYRVIKMFTDLQDKEYAYQVGDKYPREGLSPTDERITELSSNRNKQGVPLIEAVAEAVEFPEEDQETDVSTTEEKPKKRRKRDK